MKGFSGGSMEKNLLASAEASGYVGLSPGLVRISGEGNGHPLHYSCLENSMDRGAWLANPWGHKESDRIECACES